MVLGSCWEQYCIILDIIWGSFEDLFGSCWEHIWFTVGTRLGYLGNITGSFWGYLGSILASFSDRCGIDPEPVCTDPEKQNCSEQRYFVKQCNNKRKHLCKTYLMQRGMKQA
jgi:hypothetical protein